jgi:hypothetical protein
MRLLPGLASERRHFGSGVKMARVPPITDHSLGVSSHAAAFSRGGHFPLVKHIYSTAYA